MIIAGLKASPNSIFPNIEPAPKISLTVPKSVRDKVKPRPIPIPSKVEAIPLFLEAKLSALASIIQFTTISGINNSSFVNNSAIMGGAIYNIGTIYSIANTNFTENIVTSSRESTYGGAIYNTGTIGRIYQGKER